MLKLLWRTKLGLGVIDCAISHSQEKVIAGDVNGDLVIISYDGDKQFSYSYDMPIWGVDISSNANLYTVGLASKSPSKGGFIIARYDRTILEEYIDVPVWDVKIIEDRGKVVASTWGNGVYEYDLSLSSITQALEGKDVYGISIGEHNELFLTVAREGLYSLTAPHESQLLSRSVVACYNNAFAEDTVIFGSSSNIVSLVNVNSHLEKHYKLPLSSPCGIEVLGDKILLGDLDGNLIITKTSYPNAPIFYDKFDGGIWNIEVDKENSLVFIACGDGYIYCYELSNTPSINRLPAHNIALLRPALQGIKVFLSYAHEDQSVVRVLYESLSSMGCEPWVDFQNLLPGQDWKYEIKVAIKNCDFFIICLSKQSVTKRGFVQKEIREGLEILEQIPEGQIFLIPLRLDDCHIPEILANRHYVDLFSDDGLYKLFTAMYYQTIRK